MNISITTPAGHQDVTRFVPTLKWSGDYQQAARTLEFSVLASSSDPNIPVIDCPLGALVQMTENGETLFDGYIVSRSKNTDAASMELSCFDRGFYLKRIKAHYKFASVTPEAVVSRLAAEYGFILGEVAMTGVPITRSFLSGNDSLYDIMATTYTLAAETTKKKYHIGFRADQLCVTVKEPDARTLLIRGGANLIAANTSESIEQMVNAVKIYDQNDNFIREIISDEAVKLYGRLQEIIKKSQDDPAAAAQKLLDDGGVEQKITIESLGNVANVTGGAVVVQEPYTGLYGLFFIDSDIHEWKRGSYYNQLVINFKNLMDEKEAGSIPSAAGRKTG